MSKTTWRRCATVLVAVCSLATAAQASAGAVGVDPPTHVQSADPGEVIHLTKTVSTPEIPPMPDIVLLVDRTGSMGGAIDNVKANMANVVSTVQVAQPEAQFAVASYCDFGEPNPFLLHTDLSADPTTVVDAVDSISLCGGGDGPEAQLNALWEIGDGGNAVTFREGSSPIVVWFGDAPGHDPSGGHTEADATASLVSVAAKVVAVSVGRNNLDTTGQATRITNATGGTLLTGVGADEVSTAILEGLGNLPVEVAASTACDPGVSVSLSPASQTVTSGNDAVFDETITVAADAPQGQTVGCEVSFSLNGVSGGPAFVQSVSIDVNDVTAPEIACPPGPNPAGNEPAASNQDGFWQMTTTDNVDAAVEVWVHDDGSSAVFGPFAPDTTFKLTQAPGATPSVKAGHGAVDYRIKLNGDASLVAVDDAGNTATASCLVPPPPS